MKFRFPIIIIDEDFRSENTSGLGIRAFAKAIEPLGLTLLPPVGERLWTLNAVKVPHGVDDAAVRKYLLQYSNIEIGAGLGPLAGKVFRIGLIGTSSSQELVDLLTGALEKALNSLVQGLHKPGA